VAISREAKIRDLIRGLTMRLVLAAIFITLLGVQSVNAGDPDGFGMWKAADFEAHEKALDHKVRADHSARETLGDYGNHRIRMIHRVATGAPEFHTNYVDLWVVESGHATLVVGGTLVDAKSSGGDGEMRGEMSGSAISGGERHEIVAGDVIHIPAKVPHQALVPDGGEITYLRIVIPAQ
jgi:mannose-6-phosphate isomerase-like protein (cupin superfamily)